MRRTVIATVVIALLSGACTGPGAGEERIVRVDFQHDEFASHYWRFFPGTIQAHPGDTVVFRQEWTGEPHTVTFGTVVDSAVPRIRAVEEKYATFDEEVATERELEDAEAEYNAAFEGLPRFFDTEAPEPGPSQPCYLRTGKPPTEADEVCPKRSQPEFDGAFAYYSSGYIPPSGPSGNTYEMELADDLDPGTYNFYCVIHFPPMEGKLVVKEKGTELPTASEVTEQTRDEIEELAAPLREAYGAARGGRARYGDEKLRLPVGGYHSADEYTVAIDEFIPRTVRAKVNDPVTWTLVGAHTVSFDVPKYVPIFRVRNDGTVARNPVVDRPAGGSPKIPGPDFTKPTYDIDGGTWDGSGFISSGLLASEPYSKYTLRVSKPGRYRFACLVHPDMVGTLIVSD